MKPEIDTICVFCGSSPGTRDEFTAAAVSLGGEIAKRGMTLVYGGSRVGLMNTLADAALDNSGRVIGVMPETLLAKGVAHQGLTELRIVGSLQERNAQMAGLAQAFVALPGGLGTLQESFEVLTLSQLGMHHKPFGLLNIAGYYDILLEFFDHMVAHRFIRPAHRDMIQVADRPSVLIEKLQKAESPSIDKWLDRRNEPV